MENYIIPSTSQILIFLILSFALIVSTYTRKYIEDDIEKYYKKMGIISFIILISLIYFNYYIIIFIFIYLLIYRKNYKNFIIALQTSIIIFLSLLNTINSYYEFSLILLFIIFSSFSYKK
ncbi:THUMP domain associated with SAM-dependent methyltransferase [Candidatus Nanobsidianus stetteri]|uniref:THUMP domain associated with SAM-dependent methyltransferase n=1 Tax=Nanobsidianus stetteri TaxID=1294122 RepID=R1E4M4_NANST|nr:THUMP domain associated with SAM-dependent methyltransferase [Candidatus Nanobsidianus stetteri]